MPAAVDIVAWTVVGSLGGFWAWHSLRAWLGLRAIKRTYLQRAYRPNRAAHNRVWEDLF